MTLSRRACFIAALFAMTALAASPRCAFDLGAGETKVLAVDGDGRRLFAEKVAIPFRRHLVDARIPEPLLDEAASALRRLKGRCAEAGAVAFAGVAASVFRQAVNGREALARLEAESGIALTLVTAEEEAELALVAAAAATGLPASRLVAWDLGGGSTQFCYVSGSGALVAAGSSVGTESFREAMSKRFRRDPVSPVTEPEFREMVAEARRLAAEIPPGIAARLAEGALLVAVSSAHTDSVYPIVRGERAREGALAPYCAAELAAASRALLPMTLDELHRVFPRNHSLANQITNAALVQGYLEALRAEWVTPVDVTLCDGLLAASTPRFWRSGAR